MNCVESSRLQVRNPLGPLMTIDRDRRVVDLQPGGFARKLPTVGAKRRPPDHESLVSAPPGGVQEFWHAFSVRNHMNDDPVVCATLRTTGYYLKHLRREDKIRGLPTTGQREGTQNSLVSQRHHRIDFRGATRGDVAR
jgi:hypothetical protein